MNAVLATRSVVRRLLVSPVRIGLAVLLGGLFVLIAVVGNLNDEALVAELVLGGLLLFVVPIVALVFSVGALGDAIDDGTLVYLWLKPMPRWQLALGAFLATWQLVVPVVVAIAALVAVFGGSAALVVPAMVACGLATMAYSSIFVGLGLRTTKSLLAGLVVVLIWEGFLAGLSDSMATWTVRRWASALFESLAGRAVDSPLPSASTLSSVAVLLVISALGLGLTTRWLQTRDVP